MEFDIKCNDFKLVVNSKEIVDLNKGFAGLKDYRVRKSSKKPDNIYPEKLDSGDRYRRYFIRVDDNRYYKMWISYELNLKSQIVYQTNYKVSELFRSKSLTYILHNLESDTEAFKKIRRALSACIRMIANSYDFDLILTDVPGLTKLNIGRSIDLIDVSIIHTNSKFEDPLNLLISKYEKVPLKVLPGEVLTTVNSEDTNIHELNVSGKKVLLISGLNKYSCGWMHQELQSQCTVLPVTLFNLGTY